MLSLLLVGLRFEEVADAEVWHTDVQVFSVFDISSSELLGYFYLDIYKRFTHYIDGYLFTLCIFILVTCASD